MDDNYVNYAEKGNKELLKTNPCDHATNNGELLED